MIIHGKQKKRKRLTTHFAHFRGFRIYYSVWGKTITVFGEINYSVWGKIITVFGGFLKSA
jgi:hypothetical protein